MSKQRFLDDMAKHPSFSYRLLGRFRVAYTKTRQSERAFISSNFLRRPAPPRTGQQNVQPYPDMNPEEFLNFDKMITPSLIKIGYWIGLVAVVLVALGTIGTGLTAFGGTRVFLSGLIMLVLGPILV